MIIKVKTLVEHSNGFGDVFTKKEGAEYELPEADAAGLIADKLVAQVAGDKPAKEKPEGDKA